MSSQSPTALALIDPHKDTFSLVDPAKPHVYVEDYATFRGDGIFETVLVKPGDPAILYAGDLHFQRFGTSADMLELPEPRPDLWNRAIQAVAKEHCARADYQAESAEADGLFSIRYTLSRGTAAAMGWVMSLPIPSTYLQQRVSGLSLVTINKGYKARFGLDAPWMLIGAKTLSYATNEAAGRYARAQGADDALYISDDGVILECPTSNIIVQHGSTLSTPDPEAGLLHGTTQRLIFAAAEDKGYSTRYADLGLGDLRSADGIFVTSATRVCVPVTHIDDIQCAVNHELAATLRGWVQESA